MWIKTSLPTSVSGFHLSDSLFVLILDHTVAINDKENHEQIISVFQKKRLKKTWIYHKNHNSTNLLNFTYVQVRLQWEWRWQNELCWEFQDIAFREHVSIPITWDDSNILFLIKISKTMSKYVILIKRLLFWKVKEIILLFVYLQQNVAGKL